GVPVTAVLEAQVTGAAPRPYDFVWATGPAEVLSAERGQQLRVTEAPARGGGELRQLTQVHLRVIDLFGRVGSAQAPALYQSGRRQRRHLARRVVGALAAALLLLALLGPGFGLLAGRPSTLGGSSTGPEVTPTDTVTPTPTFTPTIPPAALAVRNVSSPLPA